MSGGACQETPRTSISGLECHTRQSGYLSRLSGLFCPTSGSSREPSSSAGSPKAARSGARPVSVIGRDQPLVAGEHDQLRHRRAEAAALVGLADVGARCQQGLAIRQPLGGGRFVRDERADLFGVPGREGERVDGPY